jgi:hypothetical protein
VTPSAVCHFVKRKLIFSIDNSNFPISIQISKEFQKKRTSNVDHFFKKNSPKYTFSSRWYISKHYPYRGAIFFFVLLLSSSSLLLRFLGGGSFRSLHKRVTARR